MGAWLGYLTWSMSAQGPQLAYVHADYLFENYAGSTEAYQDLQSKTAQWSQALDSLSKAYQAVYVTYEKQQQTGKKVEGQALEQQLQQQQTTFQQQHQQLEQKRLEVDQKMTQALVQQINAYIQEYAEKEGYDMIFTSGVNSNLVYSKEAYNATEAVLAYINKRYRGE